jgi:hypothetical protein
MIYTSRANNRRGLPPRIKESKKPKQLAVQVNRIAPAVHIGCSLQPNGEPQLRRALHRRLPDRTGSLEVRNECNEDAGSIVLGVPERDKAGLNVNGSRRK